MRTITVVLFAGLALSCCGGVQTAPGPAPSGRAAAQDHETFYSCSAAPPVEGMSCERGCEEALEFCLMYHEACQFHRDQTVCVTFEPAEDYDESLMLWSPEIPAPPTAR